MLIYKTLLGFTPPYLRYLLQPSSSTYNTHSASHILLKVPKTHTSLGRSSFQFAAFVSKRRPEDVKEVLVWRRYSELKKLYGELSYTHRNLFRRQEEFPPFPGAQLFGRFDEGVIEERRSAAEAMLLFTTNIPALYNSPQLKDFFRVRNRNKQAGIHTSGFPSVSWKLPAFGQKFL
uniref:PX domain-containing protein n=1 Tax=Hucho hucho TaxID=62062 RepID=A0A4W5QFI0_9TELE